MKVLLLNSPWINTSKEYGVKAGARWPNIRKRDRTMPFYPFPFFLAYATSVLKKAGIEAHLKDAVAEEITIEGCLDYIQEERPQIVVIETTTPSIKTDMLLAESVKNILDTKIIFVGPHATALPEETLSNRSVDYVIRYEYEFPLKEVVEGISAQDIKGLCYRRNNVIMRNDPAPSIADLDMLPYPERNEVPLSMYSEPSCRYFPNATVMGSRGCPYRCIFCLETYAYYSHPGIRYRSIDGILDEAEYLMQNYKIKEIFFDDALIKKERLKELSERIIKRGIKIYWSCWIDSRQPPDTEILALMKKANCSGIKFGLETMDEEIQKSIGKKIDAAKIKEVVKVCGKLGIFTHASYMLGLPGETKDSIRKTIDSAFSIRTTTAQFSAALPLPGTGFLKIAEEKGWLRTHNWEEFQGSGIPVIRYADCRPEDILSAMEYVRKRKIMGILKNPFTAYSFIIKLYMMKGFKGLIKEIISKTIFLVKKVVKLNEEYIKKHKS